MASTYSIDDAHGNQLTAGIQSEIEARRIAQRMATERAENVSLYETGSDEAEIIEPAVSYAIVNARGVIVSLHAEPVPAGEGWGHDHELVELARTHKIGDRISYDRHGREEA